MNLKFLARYTGQILMNLMDGQGRLQLIFPLTLLEFLLFDFSCAASSFLFPGSSGPMEISTPASISTAREMASVICRWGISVISRCCDDILGTVHDIIRYHDIKDIFSMVICRWGISVMSKCCDDILGTVQISKIFSVW